VDNILLVRRFAWLFLACAVGALIAVYGLSLAKQASVKKAEATLQRLGTAPAFELTSSAGGKFSSAELAGKVWVVDFFFSTCTGVCPRLTANMAKLQEEFRNRPQVRLVSISVDPENDTPKALREFAKRFKADPGKWVFLTGDGGAIHKLAREGFSLGSSEVPGRILHSDRFVLVDAEGRIRGYYHGTEEADVARLEKDIEGLLAQ
jgi:protein SCO1/2